VRLPGDTPKKREYHETTDNCSPEWRWNYSEDKYPCSRCQYRQRAAQRDNPAGSTDYPRKWVTQRSERNQYENRIPQQSPNKEYG